MLNNVRNTHLKDQPTTQVHAADYETRLGTDKARGSCPTFLGSIGEAGVDGVITEDDAREQGQGDKRQRGEAAKHPGLEGGEGWVGERPSEGGVLYRGWWRSVAVISSNVKEGSSLQAS